MPSRVLVVIPARIGSTRFPAKALAEIGGLPMILHVYRRAMRLRGADEVLVATDSALIKGVVEADGGAAVMTARSHRTGTSRVREVASRRPHGIVLNIQGDEPLFPVRSVERLIGLMQAHPRLPMGTLAAPSSDRRDYLKPDTVKVVCDRNGNALYFSRSPVPFSSKVFLSHIGIYAYRRSLLLRYPDLVKGPLERLEGLEQLRALENGFTVRVLRCRSGGIGVDLPEDLKRVEKRLKSR
ncbi:MAG: 3-deoxy-manno-octulosonate cytidylyltransferase [bacterium]|nr:MAG: 3-deoxy-manno-octulosonate cytidylyltransferase [bacterium]